MAGALTWVRTVKTFDMISFTRVIHFFGIQKLMSIVFIFLIHIYTCRCNKSKVPCVQFQSITQSWMTAYHHCLPPSHALRYCRKLSPTGDYLLLIRSSNAENYIYYYISISSHQMKYFAGWFVYVVDSGISHQCDTNHQWLLIMVVDY